MPKVSSVQSCFGGEPWQQIITVDSSGQFQCVLPTKAKSVLGYDSVSADSKNKCEAAIRTAKENFDKAHTSKRKVILYHAAVSGHIGRQGSCVLNETEILFTEGTAVDVWAGVFEETLVKTEGREIYDYEEFQSSIPSSLRDRRLSGHRRRRNQFDWTQEREDFFARLIVAIEHIALALNNIKHPELLNRAIESGAFKMLEEGVKEV